MADDFGERNFGRQVAHPAAHQVENAPARRQALAIELRERRNGDVVDVGHKARRNIKRRVVLHYPPCEKRRVGKVGSSVVIGCDHSANVLPLSSPAQRSGAAGRWQRASSALTEGYFKFKLQIRHGRLARSRSGGRTGHPLTSVSPDGNFWGRLIRRRQTCTGQEEAWAIDWGFQTEGGDNARDHSWISSSTFDGHGRTGRRQIRTFRHSTTNFRPPRTAGMVRAWLRCMPPDATMLPPDNTVVSGPALEPYLASFEKSVSHLKLTTTDVVRLSPDYIRELGIATFDTLGAKPTHLKGTYVVVWKRVGRSWKLWTDIFH